jgi:AraC-like DNA-binding protein
VKLVPHHGVWREQAPPMEQRRRRAESDQFRTRAREPGWHPAKITSTLIVRLRGRWKTRRLAYTLALVDRRSRVRIPSMDAGDRNGLLAEAGAHIDRVELSIGGLDLVQFNDYAHSFPRHSHDFFTVGVFATGNGRLIYRAGTWPADEGAVLAVSPDEVHTAEPRRDRGWTYCAMYPTVDLMAHALGPDANSASVLFPAPVFHDDALALELLDVLRLLRALSPELATEERLLSVLRRLVSRHSETPVVESRISTRPRAVAVAREYLHAHYSNSVKLIDLATVCGTSPFHLVRSFRDAVGMPPHAYLTQIRSNHARDMLLRGIPVSAAAYHCGFADQSHLTRTFKRIFGVTPGAYVSASKRAMARGN